MSIREIEVSRERDLLRLRSSSGRWVYELVEDMRLGQWEARSWVEGSDVSDLGIGERAVDALEGFDDDVVDAFLEALDGEKVRQAREQPLQHLRQRVDAGDWAGAAEQAVQVALDPRISAEDPGARHDHALLATALAQIALARKEGST